MNSHTKTKCRQAAECDTCKHMRIPHTHKHMHIDEAVPVSAHDSVLIHTRVHPASQSFVKAWLCHEKCSNPSRFLLYLKILNGWPLKRRNWGCEDCFNCISCQKAKLRCKPAEISAVARLEQLCFYRLFRGRLECFCLGFSFLFHLTGSQTCRVYAQLSGVSKPFDFVKWQLT